MRLVRMQIGVVGLMMAVSAQGGQQRSSSSSSWASRPVPGPSAARPRPPAPTPAPAPAPINSPAMAHVRALFEQGVAANQEDVLGWQAGRCYLEGDTKTYSGLLAGWKSEENGPLFPGQHKFTVLYEPSRSANYYDHLNADSSEGQRIQEAFDQRDPKISVSQVQDNALLTSYTPGDTSLMVGLRTKDSYKVAKLSSAGKTLGYCYFFKTIK